MQTVIRRVVEFFRDAWAAITKGWEKLNETDKTVFSISFAVLGFALVFTDGLLNAGAVFAVSLLLSLGMLCWMVPPVLKALIQYRVTVDFVVTIGALVLGFVSGSALIATSLMMFGLAVTAGLRLGAALDPKITRKFTWDQIFPMRAWREWFGKSKSVKSRNRKRA